MPDLAASSPKSPDSRPVWRRPLFIIIAAIVVLNIVTMSAGRRRRRSG